MGLRHLPPLLVAVVQLLLVTVPPYGHSYASPTTAKTSTVTAANTSEWTGCLISMELEPSETELEFSGSVQYSGLDLGVAQAGEEVPSLTGSWQLGVPFDADNSLTQQLTDEDCLKLLADATLPAPTSILLLPAEQQTMQLAPNPVEMDLQISFGTITQTVAEIIASDVTVSLSGSGGQPLLPVAGAPGAYVGPLDTTITGGEVQALSEQFSVNQSAALGGPPASAITTVQLIREISQEGVKVGVRIANYSSSFFVQVDDSTSGTIVINGAVAAHASLPLPTSLPQPTSAPLEAEDPLSVADCVAYSCSDPSAAAILKVLDFDCSDTDSTPAGLQDAAAANGDVACNIEAEFSLSGNSAVLSCQASNCSLSLSAGGVAAGECSGLQCSCPGECFGLGSVISTLSSASFACSSASVINTTCDLDVGGAMIPLTATMGCESALCPKPTPTLTPTQTEAAIVTETQPAPPPAASLGPLNLETSGKEVSQADLTEKCPIGLSGIGCTFCASDGACGVGSECDGSFFYGSTSASKSYACVPDNSDVANIVTNVGVMCNTTGSLELEGLSDVDPKKSYCNILTEVTLAGQEVSVGCTAYNCGVAINSSKVTCASTSCNCGPANPDCSGLAGLVEGIQSASINCNATGSCSVVLEGLPLGSIGLSCETGTCTGSGEFNGTDVSTQAGPDWLRLQVAAVGFLPTVVLLLCLIVTLVAARGCTGVVLACGGSSTLLGLPSAAVAGHLAFLELTVSVPQRRQRAVVDSGADSNALDTTDGFSESTSATGSPLQVVDEKGKKKNRGPADVPSSGAGSSGSKRVILSGVSCSASKGEVLAIMGPSGSGKTTLLSILAAREGDLGRGAKVQGAVLVDGARRKQRAFRSACAYVPQDDTLFASLTVRETVAYSARFRMPELASSALNDRVDFILEELRLSHVAGTRIGSAVSGSSGRGVSGGERRRVSIAMEMVTEPSIIMLDEPTSGLDSFAAGSLMGSLKDIALGGRVVVLTLHQPSPVAFLQLDKVLLLAAGQRVFHGSPAQAEPFFASAGFPCPAGIPVADHMLEVVSGLASREAVLREGESLDPAQIISSQRAGGENDETEADQQEGSSPTSAMGSPAGVLAWLHRRLVGTDILLWRNAANLLRSPALLLMHNLIGLLMGCAMGAVFYGVDDSLAGLQNKAGGIFFTLAFFAFCSLTTVDSFLVERSIVMREVQSGYYTSANYMAVKIMLDSLLLRVLPAVLFGVPFYYLMGLSPDWERVLVFFAVLTTFSATAGALAMAATVGCPTAGTANLIMTLVLLTSLVFGGFLANLEVMPPVISWISYLSIFRYAFEALVVNEVTGTFFDLDVSGFAVDGLDSQLMLDVLGLDASRFFRDAAVLSALFFAFSVAAGIVLMVVMPRHGRQRSCTDALKVLMCCGKASRSRVGRAPQFIIADTAAAGQK